ncbi:hypothetical protein [Psychroflexus sp. ALD_RP9]|uniref:hypothetical protein n=1 Tax=Psychroflexus sp. ALD_RP9 TaxID=2777186 RepID=UPI001F5D33D0|nr:hypothetical protein [Psychroflexus sp. ALD_RP9]
MINTKKQGLFTTFILVGAALLIYDLVEKPDVVYYKIIGLVLLMFGLYNSTKQWAQDNPKDHKNPAETDLDNNQQENTETDKNTTEQFSVEDKTKPSK